MSKDMDSEHTPTEEIAIQPAKPRKRSTTTADIGSEASQSRPKRGKYTTAACDECKKRKLKCIPAGEGNCERCITGGLTCVFAVPSPSGLKNKTEEIQQLQALSHEMSQLRLQVGDLVEAVRDLKAQAQGPPTVSSCSRENIVGQSPASANRGSVPKQPQFIGPTRSAFGILVGERSLNRMGVPTFESLPPSGAQSPTGSTSAKLETHLGFWERCTATEFAKFLVVFQEEVESVYPFIDISEYATQSQDILDAIQSGATTILENISPDKPSLTPMNSKDVDIAKVALATGMILETPGTNDLSALIVDSVERNHSSILNTHVHLKEIQLLTMLSIYYFHSDDELLAWRTIGIAARAALEMGLHRKRSLLDNFKDTDSRQLAIRVFWCVYVLDRRWSFGTSLSFALVDKDIDPELPKPDSDYAYLRCMVGYGQLCSKLWDAIPPFGSASQTIPDDVALALDLCTQDWLESIPSQLQLRHPRLGLAPRSQPRLIHRLRALLYLRGNYARILIYRHHLMSAASIAGNNRSAWLVVDIAQDTIQVLVHLHATSDIYSRQQNAFNYFLLSALAVIFLAVCHAPSMFAAPCRKNFSEGVELVRGLSRRNIVSRRLWRSIRGLVPRIRTLGGEHLNPHHQPYGQPLPQDIPEREGVSDVNGMESIPMPSQLDFPMGQMMPHDTEIGNSVPEMYQVRDDLLSLFDAFGQGQPMSQSTAGPFHRVDTDVQTNDDGVDISRRFQDLI